jgi:hypothetical protein
MNKATDFLIIHYMTKKKQSCKMGIDFSQRNTSNNNKYKKQENPTPRFLVMRQQPHTKEVDVYTCSHQDYNIVDLLCNVWNLSSRA